MPIRIKGLAIVDTKLSVHWTGVRLPSPPPFIWGSSSAGEYLLCKQVVIGSNPIYSIMGAHLEIDRYDDGGE